MDFLKIYLFIHCVYVPNESLMGFFFLFRKGGNREQGRGLAQKGGLKRGLLTLKVRPEVRLYVPEVKLVC